MDVSGGSGPFVLCSYTGTSRRGEKSGSAQSTSSKDPTFVLNSGRRKLVRVRVFFVTKNLEKIKTSNNKIFYKVSIKVGQ